MGTDQGVPGGDTNERNFSGVGISVGGFGIKISERFSVYAFDTLSYDLLLFAGNSSLSLCVLYGRIH